MHHPVRMATAVVVAVAAAIAGGAVTAEPLPEPPSAFDVEIAALCTDVVNDTVQSERFTALGEGAEAGFEVLLAIREERIPDDTEISGWADAIAGQRSAVSDIVTELESYEPANDAVSTELLAWDLVTASGRDLADELSDRLTLLVTGDWDRVVAEWQPLEHDLVLDGELALAVLGQGESSHAARDCYHLFRPTLSVPDSGVEAYVAAAAICSDLVSAEQTSTYGDDLAAMLTVVFDVASGTTEPVDDETLAAMRRLGDHLVDVHEQLSAVDPADTADPDGWQAMLDYVAARGELVAERAAAAESGDEARLIEAFRPGQGRSDVPGWPFGLDRRDCAALQIA